MLFGASVKIGTIQRRLALSQRMDDTHNSRRSIAIFFNFVRDRTPFRMREKIVFFFFRQKKGTPVYNSLEK